MAYVTIKLLPENITMELWNMWLLNIMKSITMKLCDY